MTCPGDSSEVKMLHGKMICILEELRIQMDPAILKVCTIPYNMKADHYAMEMHTKVRNLNEVVIRGVSFPLESWM